MNSSASAWKSSARIVTLATVIAAITSGCDSGDPKPARRALPEPVVQVVEVKPEKVPILERFSGTLQAVRRVEIVPRVSGYIDKRHFIEGSIVKKGDELYLIDPRPYQATLDRYKAQRKRDVATKTFYEEEVKRYKEAASTGAASVEQLGGVIAKRDEVLASIEEDDANIEKASLDLSFTKIAAPFTGRIETTQINVGALVTKNVSVLTELVQVDPIYVVFNATRSDLFRFQEMQRKGLIGTDSIGKLKVRIFLSNHAEYPHLGTLDFISSQIDPTTDSVMMRATLPNDFEHSHDIRLWPGQYVPVEVILGERADAIVIPQKAVVQTQAGVHVVVVGKDDRVEIRPLELGEAYGNHWVVEQGLKAGDRVVVEGQQVLRPKMKVRIKPPAEKSEGHAKNNAGD